MSIVFYKEDDRWIAHCLEFDLLGDGETQDEALSSLSDAIVTQLAWSIEQDDRTLLFRPAPSEFYGMFAEAEDVCDGQLNVHFLEPPRQEVPENLVFEAPRLRQFNRRNESGRQTCMA